MIKMQNQGSNKWITPFVIQCFVTAGVSLNMSSLGVVMGYAAVLLPQLSYPGSELQVDDEAGSWIAAVPGLTIIFGNFVVPVLMGRLGRKSANLASLTVGLLGWLAIAFARNVPYLIAIRFIQGIGMGIIATLGPVLIGEYTSPKNRGAFLMTCAISISLGVFAVHTMGSFISWQTTAFIVAGVSLLNFLLILLSPESPTFLADKERYEECRKTFRYLRGDTEDEELEKMIATSMILKNKKEKLKRNLMQTLGDYMHYLKETVVKKEVYKPVIIMIHVYAMSYWSGVSMMTAYISSYFEKVSGTELNLAMIVITLDINRTVVSVLGLFLIKMVRRRILMFIMVGINIVVYLTIAGYTYAKENDLLLYDNPIIGIMLIHVQMFSVAAGAVPLAFVLAGEIFPREFKGVCGGVSTVFMSLNIFYSVKTIPILFQSVGVSGACLSMCCIVAYCLLVVGLMLPETKDRTLQDIEEQFKGTAKD